MQKILEKIKNEPTIFMFQKMWKFMEKDKAVWLFGTALFALSYLIKLLEPLVFAKFFDELQANGLTELNVYYLIAILASLMLVELAYQILHRIALKLNVKCTFDLTTRYRKYLLGGTFDLPISWHAEHDSGSTIDKINNAVEGMGEPGELVPEVIQVVITLFGTTIAIIFFAWQVGLIVLALNLLTLYLIYFYDKEISILGESLNTFGNKVSAKVFDAISNITSIKILHLEKSVLKDTMKSAVMPRATYIDYILTLNLKWMSAQIALKIIVVVPLMVYMLYGVNSGTAISIGTISALFLYLSRISEGFLNFSWVYESLIMRKVQVVNANELEQAIENNQIVQSKKQEIKHWNELKISNLDFSYHDVNDKKREMHLDKVNITIKNGERIAFIGESGSGKTTFLKVLHGLYDTARASLTIDDRDKKETNFVDIDLATMLVPQEPEIFSSTIKENITLGLPIRKKEIEQVLVLARFSDVVKKLPKKLLSVVNEKGVNLSGGQKQRLALARALLFARDKQILLLDESTSSVDPENESMIYENIFEKYTNKTILASIHKMNLLKYFDRIVIFKDGKLIDNGTFDELLKNNRQFKKDWEEFVRGGGRV